MENMFTGVHSLMHLFYILYRKPRTCALVSDGYKSIKHMLLYQLSSIYSVKKQDTNKPETPTFTVF